MTNLLQFCYDARLVLVLETLAAIKLNTSTHHEDSSQNLPQHIAIVMDGNGRWARQRFLPRFAGHRAGVDTARDIIKACAQKGIKTLSLFAFSSENWQRPAEEVSFLMDLFLKALSKEVAELHRNGICLRFIGDRSRFQEKLQKIMTYAEELTQHNQQLQLVIAVNYGGQWDILQATKKIAQLVSEGKLTPDGITPELFRNELCLAGLPEPDLLIRTSGEKRISNFFLWQLAYAELYFTDTYWPDFKADALEKALDYYIQRQRRFGLTSEQITRKPEHA